MKLSQAEIIQLLRKRTGMNQGTFGAKAFNTTFKTGRTRIKNIELGKQAPTPEDLADMAAVLQVPVSDLIPDSRPVDRADAAPAASCIAHAALAYFPGLEDYLELLNKAAQLDDLELITHIAAKMRDLLKTPNLDEIVKSGSKRLNIAGER